MFSLELSISHNFSLKDLKADRRTNKHTSLAEQSVLGRARQSKKVKRGTTDMLG